MSESPTFEDSMELRVTLREIQPPVWRSLTVPADIPLAALHEVLQVAFGWEDTHGHVFEVSGIRFGFVDEELQDEELTVDEQAAPLGAVAREGSQFLYSYDFDDEWDHDVLVEHVRHAGEGVVIRCTGGERACPPEECGGPDGFVELLQALKDPQHPEHAEVQAMVGPNYDSERFDIDAVNTALAALTKELVG